MTAAIATPKELEVGQIRIDRHTRKYMLGSTLFDLGKMVLSPKKVVEPKVHVHAIYEIPEGLNMVQGEYLSEKDFLHARFYVSEKIAGWAFKELQNDNRTLQTLSPSFAGRDVMKMKEFLIKNYVHKR